MKFINSFLIFSILLMGCQPSTDNSANEAFEKNSETVKTFLEGFENENLDHTAYFADNFVMRGTTFGAPDSLSAADAIAADKDNWAMYDFELLDELVLLPGVNVDTKQADGSVRYYGDWKVTLPATDSTEARSAVIKLYESFDFNDEGKIVFMQFYGDVGGAFYHLHSQE